ncbi:MAG: imidazoleglycerol-phosphate dehydratase HisB [Verrucomicrobiota bacterium]|jgi:imidazoleglycerol-phosphate dehydratase|nr:imidazoleglycerol-phosphate dehydratase HisB [Verrucomicrobiota bacterium]HCF94318.1 imidazoleglycerol-phosphate dehydratase HisB [Verrucomicrobiota bacterium]
MRSHEENVRQARRVRQTRETKIEAELFLDGLGSSQVATGIGFFNHMLELFARHSLIDLNIKVDGDLNVDPHHTVEDSGLVLGTTLDEALGKREGIRRYGSAFLPMDETLVRVVVDLSGRPFLHYQPITTAPGAMVGAMPFQLVEEFWRAFAMTSRICLHMEVLYGKDLHHIAEALFKGAARALRTAIENDPRMTGVPSTKGVL